MRRLLASAVESVFHAGDIPQSHSTRFNADLSASISLNAFTLDSLSGNAPLPRSGMSLNWNEATNTAKVRLTNNNAGILDNGWYEATWSDEALPINAEHRHAFRWVQGDLNHDGVVSNQDIGLFLDLLNGSPPAGTGPAYGDMNRDGVVNNQDISPFINALVFGVQMPNPLTSPGQLDSWALSSTSIRINWTPPIDGTPDGYRIYRSTDGTNFTQVAQLANPVLLPGGFFWDDTNLSHGTKYWYRVRPFTFAAGNGHTTDKHWSVTVLPAPANVVAANGSGCDVALSWTAASSNVTRYRILASFNAQPFVVIDSVPGSVTQYQFHSGVNGSAMFAVQAETGVVHSAIAPSPVEFTLTSRAVRPVGEGSWQGNPDSMAYGDEAVRTLTNLPLHTHVGFNEGWIITDGQFTATTANSPDAPMTAGPSDLAQWNYGAYHMGSAATITVEHNAIEGSAPGQSGSVYWASPFVSLPVVKLEWMQDGSEDPPPGASGTTSVKFRARSIEGAALRPGSTVHWRLSPESVARADDFVAGEGWAVVDGAGHAIIELVPTNDDRVEANEQVAIELVNDGVEPFLVGVNGALGFANQGVRDNDFSVIGATIEFVGDQGVKRDLGTQELYSGPEWVDLVKKPEGAAQAPVGRDSLHDDGHKPVGYPVSYRRSNGGDDWRKAKTSVTFTVNATDLPTDANTKWWIVGDDLGRAGSNSEFATEAGVRQLADGKWEVKAENIESSFALPDTIEFYPEWTIDWRLEKRVDGRDPKAAVYGKSVNRLYITGGDAVGELETVLRIGCDGAHGKKPVADSERDAVAESIWGVFATRKVRRAADDEILKYWGAGADTPDYFTKASLVRHADGRCQAWAELMQQALRAQGVTDSILAGVVPLDWPLPPMPEGWEFRSRGFIVKLAPAQGLEGDQTYRAFPDHAVIYRRSSQGRQVIFDPSYGGDHRFESATIGEAERAWMSSSLDNKCVFARNPQGGITVVAQQVPLADPFAVVRFVYP